MNPIVITIHHDYTHLSSVHFSKLLKMMKFFALFVESELDLTDVSPGINNNYE